MKKIRLFPLILLILLALFLLSACDAEETPLQVKEELLQYGGMKYQQFYETTDTPVERNHGLFLIAPIPDSGLQAVFQADQYNEKDMTAILTGDGLLCRLEGKLEDMLTGLSAKLPVEEFSERLVHDGKAPEYTTEEGVGTAYYVADHYLSFRLSDEMELKVAVSEDETVGPESYAWLLWPDVSAETPDETMPLDTEMIQILGSEK